MVVIYVPEDKRWSTIGEGLGKGLGGLLAGWAEGHANQQMAQQIAQMSQDPKYTNNPQQLYMDAEAKWPGVGGASYLKSLDAGLKIAEAKYYSTRGGTTDLDRQKKELEIQELQERIKREPQNAQELNLRIQKAYQDLDVGAATAPARKELPGLEKREREQKVKAGEEKGENRGQLLAPPDAEPPPAPGAPEAPPKPQSGVQLPGEASRQLAALSGDEDPERIRAVSRFGDIDKPLPSLASLGATGTQYAQAATPTATDAAPATGAVPSVATPGPPPDPNAPTTPGPQSVIPSLQPSLSGGSNVAPPPAPTSAPNGPPQVPGPNLTPPQPAQRALSPQAVGATAQLAPPPAGSPAPPPGAAFTGQPDSGLRPPQLPAPKPVGTQDQPLGLPQPGSDEFQRQADTVKARMNQRLQDTLSSMGIKHPQEQLEVYNKLLMSNDENFDRVFQDATKTVLARHEQQAEHGYTETEKQREYQYTQAAEQYRFDKNQFREQYQFMETYGKPQLMKREDLNHIAASLSVLETDKPFLSPRAATGGIGASWYDWLQSKGAIQGDANWLSMSTAAHQQVVAAATTGGGLAGGKWRTQNAEVVTPSELHQNFQNVMMIESNAKRDMAELQTIYWQYAGKPGQEQNAEMAARAYNARKAEYEQADTLWWGKDVAPDGKTLTGPFHYFYQGVPVDRSLKEVPGGPQMLKDDQRYKNKMTGEVTDGSALNDKARAAGMIPDAYLRVYSWLPDRG